MIQAHELRIGNYLRAVEPEHNGKVFAIGIGDITEVRKGMPRYKYEPIPLTPEILEACGFEQRHSTSRVHKLTIAYEDSDYPCTLQSTADGIQICRSGIGAITAHLKYLHELQNLFFILTGKELSVNIAKTVPA